MNAKACKRPLKDLEDVEGVLAWLTGLPRDILAAFLASHWRLGDRELTGVRLRGYRVSAANAARLAREPVSIGVRREVHELIAMGLARNREAAFLIVARNRSRSVATIRSQFYRGPQVQRRHVAGAGSRQHTLPVAATSEDASAHDE